MNTLPSITLASLMAERGPGIAYELRIVHSSIPMKSTHDPMRTGEMCRLLHRLRESSPKKFQQDYFNHLDASLKAYENHQSEAGNDSMDGFDERWFEALQNIALEHRQAYLSQICRSLGPISTEDQMMQLTGVWPLMSTHALLKSISIGRRKDLPPPWISLLSNHAISINEVMRMKRILQISRSGMQTLLQSEIKYMRTWKPSLYPDWLLVEIEANMSIRPVQAAVAERMLNPDGARNSILQLNMGEGKSSVIVPITAASASNGRNLCRVMVLGPQMKQQFQILRRTLTGLSNRRILYLPFSRKLQLDTPAVTRIQEYLRQGMKDGAIWICEPEHILSLKLLGLDRAIHTGSRELIDLHSWLHNHCKDILDESDEILHTRQQVIYTIGSQQSLDATSSRWEVIQKLLGHLAIYLNGNRRDQHPSSFLIKARQPKSAFPIIRIKSEDARELQVFIANSLQQNDWPLPPHMKVLIIEFVTKLKPSADTVTRINSYCSQEDGRVMQMILILRGMIAYDILLHSFKDKRWRVQYGLDLRRSKLAVPFRAKDSPSPRSEFGHPDVTILLTCLSYYYGGLDIEMVTHTLQALLSTDSPDQLYKEWLESCEEPVTCSLRTVKGVNLKDEELLHMQIFPLLRYNKAVIDFYLNTFIFPAHAKEFPFKMSTSGWDLAIKRPIPTTGFSGTNDGRLLLPANITQIDQPAQLHTNAKVLSYILRPENATVVCYPSFTDAADLLKVIHKLPLIKVILDVGAQILDLSNIDFTKIWLGMYRDDEVIKAAVCFDEKNNMLVITRDGVTQSFVDSPYADRLDQCLIYLDEGHTRGTDLRIPIETRAVVTLGPKLSKDKLVQGCMRMRKLGHGHSLVFMASEEVIDSICEVTGLNDKNITTEDVLYWSIKETWHQLQGNVASWAIQGRSFVHREAVWNALAGGELPKEAELSKLFCDPEARTLDKLYGAHSGELEDSVVDHYFTRFEDEIGKKIVQRCQDFYPFSISSSGLHEEREIELVHEKEEEREVEVAPDAEPVAHALHPVVDQFIRTGDTQLCQSGTGFTSAREAFKHTSFAVPAGFDRVFANIALTKDFLHTIQIPSIHSIGSMDKFMRSVNWVVTAAEDSNSQLMVLFSPYEVDQLLPRFRTSTKVKLHMFASRTDLAVRSLEDLDFLTLPSTPIPTSPPRSIPKSLALQLNLFSGSLYFRDYQTYLDVCRVLRLHFDELPAHLEKPEIINANFFVLDPKARAELGMGKYGFNVNVLPFFQDMIRMRRFGREFGPSHMGKILHGTRIKRTDFPEY